MFQRVRISFLRMLAGITKSADQKAKEKAYHLGYKNAHKPARPVPGYEVAYFNGRKHALDSMAPNASEVDDPILSIMEKRQKLVEQALSHIIGRLDRIEKALPGGGAVLLTHQPSVQSASQAATQPAARSSAPAASSAPVQAQVLPAKEDAEKVILPYGKHKGMALGTLSTGYLSGLLKGEIRSDKLRAAIMSVLSDRVASKGSVSPEKAPGDTTDKKKTEKKDQPSSSTPAPVSEPPADFDEIPVDSID